MKIFYKRILSKKGMTLVEILIVLIVASVLLLCATGMLAPVNNLLNSVKGNAHMYAMCNTANEYIRGTLQKAKKISIFAYHDDGDDIESEKEFSDLVAKYDEYANNLQTGDKIKMIGALIDYPGDYRLYDFGDVTDIQKVNRDNWGLETANYNIERLVQNRDGGDNINGKNWSNFRNFLVFHDDFYSNGSSGEVNNSYLLGITVDGSLDAESGVTGIKYITLTSQIIKRVGSKDDYANMIFEPVNQEKKLTFKLLNGNAELNRSKNVNLTDNGDGTFSLNTAKGTVNGVIILYVETDFDELLNP